MGWSKLSSILYDLRVRIVFPLFLILVQPTKENKNENSLHSHNESKRKKTLISSRNQSKYIKALFLLCSSKGEENKNLWVWMLELSQTSKIKLFCCLLFSQNKSKIIFICYKINLLAKRKSSSYKRLYLLYLFQKHGKNISNKKLSNWRKRNRLRHQLYEY